MAQDRRRNAVDQAMVQLIRLVLAEDWSAAAAALRLRESVDDPQMLRHMSARVNGALGDRPSVVTRRAALTLRVALGGRVAG